MARKREKNSKTTNATLRVMRQGAAGIDIGTTEIYATVPVGRAAERVRSFPTFTQDLYACADWLKQCRVKTVAMESTGVHWIPLHQILEDRWFEVTGPNHLSSQEFDDSRFAADQFRHHKREEARRRAKARIMGFQVITSN